MKNKKNNRFGSMAFYGFIILFILSFYLTGMQVASIDQSASNKYAYFEMVAKQGADSGLEICLRVATRTAGLPDPITGSITFNFPIALYPGPIASMTVFYSATRGDPSFASATAFVKDRNLATCAMRIATNTFPLPVVVLNRRIGFNSWSR